MQRYFPLVRREGMERRLEWHTLRQNPWVMVWTMAIAQIISWGTLFYSFSLFVVPMEESLGWSRPLLNGALSLGLLSSGIVGQSLLRKDAQRQIECPGVVAL